MTFIGKIEAKITKIAKIADKITPSRHRQRQVDADTATRWAAPVTAEDWCCSTARCRYYLIIKIKYLFI